MSQQNISILTLTLIASGTVNPYRAIGFDGAQAAVQGQKTMGTSLSQANNSEAMAVVTHGTAIVESGAAILMGDSLITDNQGRAIPASGALALAAGAVAVTSSAANGALLEGADLPEYVFADALQAAAGVGEFIEVLLRR
ncbi:MAG: DUF2190 family protein [Magnetococcales bacterium]|nr:DUF2190 family protein [Magnetococcales bacterium]